MFVVALARSCRYPWEAIASEIAVGLILLLVYVAGFGGFPYALSERLSSLDYLY
jgi:hypothetical protein